MSKWAKVVKEGGLDWADDEEGIEEIEIPQATKQTQPNTSQQVMGGKNIQNFNYNQQESFPTLGGQQQNQNNRDGQQGRGRQNRSKKDKNVKQVLTLEELGQVDQKYQPNRTEKDILAYDQEGKPIYREARQQRNRFDKFSSFQDGENKDSRENNFRNNKGKWSGLDNNVDVEAVDTWKTDKVPQQVGFNNKDRPPKFQREGRKDRYTFDNAADSGSLETTDWKKSNKDVKAPPTGADNDSWMERRHSAVQSPRQMTTLTKNPIKQKNSFNNNGTSNKWGRMDSSVQQDDVDQVANWKDKRNDAAQVDSSTYQDADQLAPQNARRDKDWFNVQQGQADSIDKWDKTQVPAHQEGASNGRLPKENGFVKDIIEDNIDWKLKKEQQSSSDQQLQGDKRDDKGFQENTIFTDSQGRWMKQTLNEQPEDELQQHQQKSQQQQQQQQDQEQDWNTKSVQRTEGKKSWNQIVNPTAKNLPPSQADNNWIKDRSQQQQSQQDQDDTLPTGVESQDIGGEQSQIPSQQAYSSHNGQRQQKGAWAKDSPNWKNRETNQDAQGNQSQIVDRNEDQDQVDKEQYKKDGDEVVDQDYNRQNRGQNRDSYREARVYNRDYSNSQNRDQNRGYNRDNREYRQDRGYGGRDRGRSDRFTDNSSQNWRQKGTDEQQQDSNEREQMYDQDKYKDEQNENAIQEIGDSRNQYRGEDRQGYRNNRRGYGYRESSGRKGDDRYRQNGVDEDWQKMKEQRQDVDASQGFERNNRQRGGRGRGQRSDYQQDRPYQGGRGRMQNNRSERSQRDRQPKYKSQQEQIANDFQEKLNMNHADTYEETQGFKKQQPQSNEDKLIEVTQQYGQVQESQAVYDMDATAIDTEGWNSVQPKSKPQQRSRDRTDGERGGRANRQTRYDK